MTADFVAHAEVVAGFLARSVECALVERGRTTGQSVLEATPAVQDGE